MAYNKSSNPLDATGKSILVQVAFKGAVEAATVEGRYDPIMFDDAFASMTAALIGKVTEVAAVPAAATSAGEDALRNELGATEAPQELSPGVRILGEQHGPLPAWFLTAAKAAGVTAVFDNRGRLGEKPKLPHFVTPKDATDQPADKPFWPPRD